MRVMAPTRTTLTSTSAMNDMAKKEADRVGWALSAPLHWRNTIPMHEQDCILRTMIHRLGRTSDHRWITFSLFSYPIAVLIAFARVANSSACCCLWVFCKREA